ncbi:MAG: hypothetical protein V3W45_04080, partial [Sedimentisphaerales bacterium]
MMLLTKKPAKEFMTLLMFIGLMLSFAGNVLAAGDESYWGYNTEQDKWTHGNLGKAYLEGDWVSYQLVISNDSKVWGATSFDISWNFHQDNTDAIYIDGFKNFQVGIDLLPNGTQEPGGGWGTVLNVGTEITDYQYPWPKGTSESDADPADERYFTVELPAGVWTGDQIVLFYQAHLALDIIWWNGLEADLPNVLDGGQFQTWTAPHHGASFATGSSRHFFLEFPGIGQKDIPIPIAQYPSGVINGHKFFGIPPDSWAPFDGWEIEFYGEFEIDGLGSIVYMPPVVQTGDGDWETGYYEFTGLIAGDFTVTEEDRVDYVHHHIDTNLVPPQPYDGGGMGDNFVSFLLDQGESATVDFYNTQIGCLELTKVVELSGVTNPIAINETFTVTVTGPSFPAPAGQDVVFTVTNGVLQAPSTVTLNDLIPGDYTITEADAGSEWAQTVPASVLVNPGETCATATVTNTYVPGCLELTKVVELSGVTNPTVINETFTVTVTGPSHP